METLQSSIPLLSCLDVTSHITVTPLGCIRTESETPSRFSKPAVRSGHSTRMPARGCRYCCCPGLCLPVPTLTGNPSMLSPAAGLAQNRAPVMFAEGLGRH